MFGIFRRKVAKSTAQLAQQPLAIFQVQFGIPVGFWQEPFVLGSFGSMIGTLASIISNGRLSETDKVLVLEDTFSKLSNLNGKSITGHFAKLTVENYIEPLPEKPINQDFLLGANYGEYLTFAMLGLESEKDLEIVKKVKKEIEQLDIPNDPSLLQMKLMMELFINPLVDRFNLENRFDYGADVMNLILKESKYLMNLK